MSLFKTRRDRRAPIEAHRVPARFDTDDEDAAAAAIEGVTLDRFVTFIAQVGQRAVSEADHEAIAVALGFPARRYDLIRNLWLARVYSSPSLAREFGERLDEARTHLT